MYYLFRLAGLVCPLLPDRLGYWIAARAGDLAFLLASRRQKYYYRNLRRIVGSEASPTKVRSIARRAFQNLLKNYFDLFRGHGLSHSQILRQMAQVQGLEYLEAAMSQGNGVIAGSAHFGSWDMVLRLAAAVLKTEIVVPNERLKPEKLNQYILALRAAQGIQVVPLDVAPRALIKALKSGHIAGIAYDRDITKTGPRVNFFGVPTQMPDGPVQLSLKYDAPVIIGFSIRQADNRSEIHIEPPVTFERTGHLDADICTGVQKLASIMEKYIREYPDQWLMFQKFWDD